MCFFFFNDTATTEIYTLSLHDALPIFVDDDAASAPELLDLRVLELEAHLLGDHLGARQDRDVLEHALAAVTETRRLDCDGGGGADRKSTRLNSRHAHISYALFFFKKKKNRDKH